MKGWWSVSPLALREGLYGNLQTKGSTMHSGIWGLMAGLGIAMGVIGLIRGFLRIESTKLNKIIDAQQRQIDDLKRELEEMKGKES